MNNNSPGSLNDVLRNDIIFSFSRKLLYAVAYLYGILVLALSVSSCSSGTVSQWPGEEQTNTDDSDATILGKDADNRDTQYPESTEPTENTYEYPPDGGDADSGCNDEDAGETREQDTCLFVTAQDFSGRTWLLEDWKDGTRPYAKSLSRRESEYRTRYGEDWGGTETNGDHTMLIMSPGTWKIEVLVDVPSPWAEQLEAAAPRAHVKVWGGAWPYANLYAPLGGEVSDVYVLSSKGIFVYDMKRHQSFFVGNPREGGMVDGWDDEVRAGGFHSVVDNITGRLYWRQGTDQEPVLRYMDKYLLFKDEKSNKEYWLPAYLEHDELYRSLRGPDGGSLVPVPEDGNTVRPRFKVTTVEAFEKHAFLPGPLRGQRPLLSPGQEAVYLSPGPSWDGSQSPLGGKPSYMFDVSHLYDLFGVDLGLLKMIDMQPPDIGSHGATVMGMENLIYVVQTGGCCWYISEKNPLRLFSLDPVVGNIDILVQTACSRKVTEKKPLIDGPADASTLSASSTLMIVQSPRTGSLYFGGWDASGIRVYHDGFVTSFVAPSGTSPRPEWGNFSEIAPNVSFLHHSTEVAISPAGEVFIPSGQTTQILRAWRTDWPEEQPPYGFGSKFQPPSRLKELMLQRAQNFIDSM